MDLADRLPITIRLAGTDDAAALRRLAALDSATVPAQPIVLAEVEGELRVGVSMSDGRAIADPFAPTAHLVDLVRDHIAGIAQAARPGQPARPEHRPALRWPSRWLGRPVAQS